MPVGLFGNLDHNGKDCYLLRTLQCSGMLAVHFGALVWSMYLSQTSRIQNIY